MYFYVSTRGVENFHKLFRAIVKFLLLFWSLVRHFRVTDILYLQTKNFIFRNLLPAFLYFDVLNSFRKGLRVLGKNEI